MDIALIMAGMAVLEKAFSRKDLLAWLLVGFGGFVSFAMLWLLACGLM